MGACGAPTLFPPEGCGHPLAPGVAASTCVRRRFAPCSEGHLLSRCGFGWACFSVFIASLFLLRLCLDAVLVLVCKTLHSGDTELLGVPVV